MMEDQQIRDYMKKSTMEDDEANVAWNSNEVGLFLFFLFSCGMAYGNIRLCKMIERVPCFGDTSGHNESNLP